jgi:hypothetical protein
MRSDRDVPNRSGSLDEGDELARALVRVADPAQPPIELLRPIVERFVAAARARGLPPEDVLRSLKDELQRYAMPHMYQDSYLALAEDVVRWGIEAYYR